ncbi:MAG: tyrosine-type recombinase/integrase [Candidatus Omnitrophota bacterium]
MKFSVCIHQFFEHYLPGIRGVSPHTIKAYRDTFTLFLPFAANRLSIKIESLMVDHFSTGLVLEFLDYLEAQRHNTPKTRNIRLATLKSFARMIRLMHPEKREIAEKILNLPSKRSQKTLIGFLTHEEMLKVFEAVNLKKNEGFRDYTLLHLLYDSGARASEAAALKIDCFDAQNKTLGILGKGNRYRLLELWPRTAQLISLYIGKYRPTPKPLYRNSLFINQRGEELTRHGIHWLCQKYLSVALSPKRLKDINPAHSFRHSTAVNMLLNGSCLSDIQNRLGHEQLQSTMIYLRLELSRKREVQKKHIEYTQSILPDDPKIEELLDWENKEKIMAWLDSL